MSIGYDIVHMIQVVQSSSELYFNTGFVTDKIKYTSIVY